VGGTTIREYLDDRRTRRADEIRIEGEAAPQAATTPAPAPRLPVPNLRLAPPPPVAPVMPRAVTRPLSAGVTFINPHPPGGLRPAPMVQGPFMAPSLPRANAAPAPLRITDPALLLSILFELIDQGLGIDNQDGDGLTPLMVAVIAQDEAAVRLLLLMGADPSLTGRHGITALDMARFRHNMRIVWLLEEAERKKNERVDDEDEKGGEKRQRDSDDEDDSDEPQRKRPNLWGYNPFRTFYSMPPKYY
jgi:hypothetical protein